MSKLRRPSLDVLYLAGIIAFAVSNFLIAWQVPSSLHWVDWSLARHPSSSSAERTTTRPSNAVAIVVTVHGALDYLAGCLESWQRHTVNSHVFLVDDCEAAEERQALQALALAYPNTTLVPRQDPQSVGYTKAVNAGLRAAYSQGYPYIAQLNSDTVLTPNWLSPLVAVLKHHPRAGAVGPVSNAASWQSVPELTTAAGSWSKNPLLPGTTPDMMAKLTFSLSDNRPIQLPILNGFCILFKRQVFEAIGYMDEVLSPRGYGEENDFAFRMRAHNYTLWTMPSSYVYHHKSKSFKPEEYKAQIAETKRNMKEKYGAELKAAERALRDNKVLEALRDSVQHSLRPSLASLRYNVSVLFVLNVMSTKKPFVLHGGWISLVQEGVGLYRNGAYARIAVPMGYLKNFNEAFPEARAADMFLGFNGTSPRLVADEFLVRGQTFDFLVATHSSTAETVKHMVQHWPNAIPSYYVQDIETKFHDEHAKEAATRSYRELGQGFVFVKTVWLQQRLRNEFGVNAHLILPTVDTTLFTPGNQTFAGRLKLCAMVRTSTPRRNPLQTLDILFWAAKTLQAEALAYGSTEKDVAAMVKRQPGGEASDFDLAYVNLVGPLDREGMRELYHVCEVFLDFSSWQAFGRSGIEAMASGVVPILPKAGGATSYAAPGVNAFLIDTSDMGHAKALLQEIVDGKHDLWAMRTAALATATRFAMDTATRHTYEAFAGFLNDWRQRRARCVAQIET